MQPGKFLVRLLLYPNWKFIKKYRRLLTRIFAALLIIGLIDFVAGCYYYKVTATYEPTAEELIQFSNLGKTLIVHQDYEVYYVSELTILDDTLHLTLGKSYYQPGEDVTPSTPNSVKRYRPKKGDARLVNEIHLYVNDQVRKSEAVWLVAASDLERLDVYNHSTGHTVAYSVLFGIALIPVAYVALSLLFLLIMLLTGNSCPFIYTYNGQEYVFAGEIYSGAIYAPLERDDYLLLPDMVEEEGKYLMKISNQLEEEQHTNLLELLIFDHPARTDLLVDKYGEPHDIDAVKPPVSATNLEDMDVLPLIENEDDLIYVGKDPTKDPPLLDGIVLTFERPENMRNVSLIVEVKNSYWLDFVYQNFREMLGISYQQWVKKQQDGDPEKMEDWSLSQHIPLAVFIWKNGEWVFQDYYHTVGPMAFKKDILRLDLSDTGEGPVRIKLEAGSYFWEIGYTALGFELDTVRPGTVVRIGRATDENGADVKASLLFDDDQYYLQPEIGNEATISFAVPPGEDMRRTIYLHSKGYYHILQDPKGLPRVRDLQEIRKSGNFNQYSNELMQAMIAEHLFQDGKRGK